MILRCVCWSIFLCLTFQQTAKAEVQVDEQGYQNVLISFAPNVPSENGKAFVQSIQELLKSTSNVLHKAIGIRIASATFLLPPSWSTEAWEEITVAPASSEQTSRRPDIWVDGNEDSPFGKQPVALQHGGCGVAGHQITMPLDFLSSTEYPIEKILAREWLKYRYGVFDENGFSGDSLYPDYYRIPGSSDIRITECTDTEVTYIFKKPDVDEVCDMESGDNFGNCRTFPESGANATSSLLYFHNDLPNMEHICGTDDHPHHNTSRNKQNALCSGRSIWDVVQQSSDFKTTQLESDDPIQFSYIQEKRPRFVVLLENSDNFVETSDATQAKPSAIKFSLRRFYYDLPPQSELAIYTYNNEVTDALSYTVLPSAEQRADLGVLADFGPSATGGILTSMGLSKAVQILLEKGETEKGSILLITASPLDEAPEFPENLNGSGICLRVLRFTHEDNDPADGTYNPLEDSFDCFSQHSISLSLDAADVFSTLSGLLKNEVPQFKDDFETKTVASGSMSGQLPVTIPHDGTASFYTLWLGRQVGNSAIVCKAGDNVVALKPGISATEIITYTIDPVEEDITCALSSVKAPAVISQVQMTTQKGNYFDFDTWYHDMSTDTEQMPIIIYAKIYFGGYPVRYANVTTVVTHGEEEKIVTMLDNGRGDPDVTRFDGIYSGYFTSFSEAGKYQITVKVNDNGAQAKIGKENTLSRSATCCGSQVICGQVEGVPAFEMEKQTEYTAENKRPDDGYAPSRILDLQVQMSNNSDQVTLTWTAPGGDKAVRYTIKLFQNMINAVSNFETTGQELNTSHIVPGDTGEVEEFVIPLQDLEAGATLFATMRSWSEFKKKSDISIVAEFITPKSDETTVEVSSTPKGITDDESTRQAQARKRTIEIVVGVLAGIVILCILVYLGIYFFVQRPKRKEEKARARRKAENGGGQRTVSSPTGQIGLNSIPADVIVKHHNEVEKAKSLHKDPPIFKEENLESINSSPELPENTRRNMKAAEYTMVQKVPEGTSSNSSQQDPSKSPKRMTVV